MAEELGGDDKPKVSRDRAGIVAIILATGIASALNIVVIALLWAAVQRLGIDVNSGISENGTQLLTGWGGGIIGVLGSYLGYTLGKKDGQRDRPPT